MNLQSRIASKNSVNYMHSGSLKNSIEVKNLHKSYQGKEVVKGIDFTIEEGKFYALLGPNGAGKTTTINILCTNEKPDIGSVWMEGLKLGPNNYEIRKKLGVVFQNGVLDELLTVEENLCTRGRLYGLFGYSLKNRIELIADITGISDFLKSPYGKLSGGQKRRCDIARALLHYPKILLLDEPATGLDPKMRSVIWETIYQMKEKMHMTLLLTTHYMEEAANADYILIMKDGRIVQGGTPDTLKAEFSKDMLRLFAKDRNGLKKRLESRKIKYEQKREWLEIPLFKTMESLEILEYCRGWYSDFEVIRGNMDVAYLSVVEDIR